MTFELWFWRQCDYFLFRQLKLVLQTVVLFAKDFKTGLVKIYDFCWNFNVFMLSINGRSTSSHAKQSLLFLTNAFKGVQEKGFVHRWLTPLIARIQVKYLRVRRHTTQYNMYVLGSSPKYSGYYI